MNTRHFYSHGKLLLTGEYLVLDGASALAVPTKKGQSLTVSPQHKDHLQPCALVWKSYAVDGSCWFACCFETATHTLLEGTPLTEFEGQFDTKIAATLYEILKTAQRLNPNFLKEEQGYTAETHLEFDRHWGLGTSSTLINNIAQWADIDAFVLLEQSFGGSGYDIACAQHDTPILYTRKTPTPLVQKVPFDPPFKEHLFFVYRNQKQDSKAAISHYRAQAKPFLAQAKLELHELTTQIMNCTALATFETVITAHEQLLAKVLKTSAVKSQVFPDYTGAIKSLGGWGGDFMLATGGISAQNYFRNKGYTTIVPFSEMVF